MDYASKVAAARKAGYSDAEIISHLAQTDPKVQQAKQAGYKDDEILAHLSPAAPVSQAQDIGKGAVSGLFQSIVGSAPNPATDALRRMVEQGADVASAIDSVIHGKMPSLHPMATTAPGSPTAQALTSAAKQDYRPQTRAGKFAQTAGSMLPAALAPGSIPQRIANVVAPTVGSEAGALINEKLGGGQTGEMIARTIGAMGGGLAANIRVTPRPRPLPAEDAAAMKYVDRVAGNRPLDEVAAASPELMGAEALGQRGKAAVGALARREGATGDVLNAEVAARQLGRPGRLLDAFASEAGVAPEAAAGDLQTLVEAGRAKAAPLYEQAYASGPIDSPQLQVLTPRPSMQRAMARAMRIASEEGREPNDLGFRVVKKAGTPEQISTKRTAQFDIGGGRTMAREVVDTANGPVPLEDVQIQVETPSAQTYDYVKRGLDDILNSYRDSTTGRLNLDEEGRAVLNTLNKFRDELTNANPAYGKALEVSGDYLSAEDAFRTAGKDIFNSNLTERQFAEKFGKLSESSQQAYKGGIANRFYDLAQNGRLDPKVLRTGRVQTKLRMALGDEGAQRLIDLASQEGDMLAFERRYGSQGNSITQEMAAAQAEQDAMGGKGAEVIGDVISKGPRKALGRQIQAALDSLGPTRGMTVAARDKAGKTLMLPPADMAKAIEAYRKLPPRGLPQVRIAPDPRLIQFLTGTAPSR